MNSPTVSARTRGGAIDLLVAGAGPVGLAAALLAANRGLRVTVLESAAADDPRPGSRAIFLHHTSLRLLSEACPEVATAIADNGLTWTSRRTTWAGRTVFHQSHPAVPIHRVPFVSLSQAHLEAHLRRACAQAGVQLVWESPVVAVDADDDRVRFHTTERTCHEADFAIGADGARSVVRGAIGARLHGARTENSFVVVDIADDPAHPLPVERAFHYRCPEAGGRNVLIVPFAGGWRIDLQCRPGDDFQALTSDPASWLTSLLPAGHAVEITWTSHYRFHQLVADAFVDPRDRVLLAGDAAHLFAPFGARGLNSGIADAAAAVSAITAADAKASVGDYRRIRRAAALHNQAAAGKALRHLRADDPLIRCRQRAAATAARTWHRAGLWLETAPYGPRGAAVPGSLY